tara:strand:+ start:3429 stop:3578 length:150 start_codon:yes stop_codon:yes gene_type:complete
MATTALPVCECEHCREIINQQDRMENWQQRRCQFNKFIEKKAKEARPDL